MPLVKRDIGGTKLQQILVKMHQDYHWLQCLMVKFFHFEILSLITYNPDYLFTVCCYHATYMFDSEPTLCSCVNVKEVLVRNRRDVWSLSGSRGIRTHNHLVGKQTLNHLDQLWVNGWVSVYELSGCGFQSGCSHLLPTCVYIHYQYKCISYQLLKHETLSLAILYGLLICFLNLKSLSIVFPPSNSIPSIFINNSRFTFQASFVSNIFFQILCDEQILFEPV